MTTLLYRPAHWSLRDRDAVEEFERQRREANLRRAELRRDAVAVVLLIATVIGLTVIR